MDVIRGIIVFCLRKSHFLTRWGVFTAWIVVASEQQQTDRHTLYIMQFALLAVFSSCRLSYLVCLLERDAKNVPRSMLEINLGRHSTFVVIVVLEKRERAKH